MPTQFTVRWTGLIRSDSSSLHVFRARADSGIRVFLDDQLIIDDWSDHAARPDVTTKIRLKPAEPIGFESNIRIAAEEAR